MLPVTADDVRRIAQGVRPDPVTLQYPPPLRGRTSIRSGSMPSSRGVFSRTWQWICHVGKLSSAGELPRPPPWPACRSPWSATARRGGCARSTTSASTAPTSCCPRLGHDTQHHLPPTTRGPTASTSRLKAARRANAMEDVRQGRDLPRPGAGRGVRRDRLRRPRTNRASLSEQAPDLAAEITQVGAGCRRAHPRQAADLGRGDQLEERHRQLPRVLPLPHRAQGVHRPRRHGHLRSAGRTASGRATSPRRGRTANSAYDVSGASVHPARRLVAVAEHLPAALPRPGELHGLPGGGRPPRPDPGDVGLLLRDRRARGGPRSKSWRSTSTTCSSSRTSPWSRACSAGCGPRPSTRGASSSTRRGWAPASPSTECTTFPRPGARRLPEARMSQPLTHVAALPARRNQPVQPCSSCDCISNTVV